MPEVADKAHPRGEHRTMSLVTTLACLSILLLQAAAYVRERVYDTQAKAFIDFEVMLARAAEADVVFVGETREDPNTRGVLQ